MGDCPIEDGPAGLASQFVQKIVGQTGHSMHSKLVLLIIAFNLIDNHDASNAVDLITSLG